MDYQMTMATYMGVFSVITVLIATIALYLAARADSRDEQTNLKIEALNFFEEYIRRHPEASDEEIEEVRKSLFGI